MIGRLGRAARAPALGRRPATDRTLACGPGRQPDDRPYSETAFGRPCADRNGRGYHFQSLGRFEVAKALGSFRGMNSFSRPAANRRPTSGEPEWLTLGQAAKFLGVAQST